MALGFTVTNITDSKVVPDKGLSRTSSPKVRSAQFGDGYEQRLADGLNSLEETFGVTFNNRAKVAADDINAFFNTNKGVTSFNFTYPDTNSTTSVTATVNGAVNSSINVTLDAATTNLEISLGATVTGAGISGTVTVSGISGTALILSSEETIDDDVTLTFTNPDEREIKVVCSDWSQSYTDLLGSSISATFKRVYEP